MPGKYFVDNISIKARKPQLDESTIELITSLIENEIPGYDFDNLFFYSHCNIRPFNTVPELVSN